MPTLDGYMPHNAGEVPEAPCVWCGAPTDLRFIPAGRPELGLQPLHLLCGAALIRAFERLKAGMVLPERDQRRLAAMAGHPTVIPASTPRPVSR